MSKRLALELLQKVSNPSHMFTELEADDDGVSKWQFQSEGFLNVCKYEAYILNFISFRRFQMFPRE